MPMLASTISRNWPMTSGTDWMRFTSSCARSSSRFRFFCSSLMYSSCTSRNSRWRCSCGRASAPLARRGARAETHLLVSRVQVALARLGHGRGRGVDHSASHSRNKGEKVLNVERPRSKYCVRAGSIERASSSEQAKPGPPLARTCASECERRAYATRDGKLDSLPSSMACSALHNSSALAARAPAHE